MPGLHRHVQFLPNGSVDNNIQQQPEDIPLFLPSAVALHDARDEVCDRQLCNLEDRLRETQAKEALEDLRRHLRTRTFASKYKIKHAVGQRANTRARQWLATIERRAMSSAKLYRHARTALMELRGPGDWERTLKVLADDDVRSLNERVLTEQEKADRAALRRAAGMPVEGVLGLAYESGPPIGEGRRTLSWIWLADGGSEDDNDPNTRESKWSMTFRPSELNTHVVTTGLRIEWAKAKARASRWWEAVNLLNEEMRRAVAFCHARSQWWYQQATTVIDGPQELQEGRRAYAFAHADAETLLGDRWAARWRPLREEAEEFMQRFPLYVDDGLAALYGQGDDDDNGGDDNGDQENGPDDRRDDGHGLQHNGGREHRNNGQANENNGRNHNDRRRNGDAGPANNDNNQRNNDNDQRNNYDDRRNSDNNRQNDDNHDRQNNNNDRMSIEHGLDHDNGNTHQYPHARPITSAPRRIVELTVDEDEFADDYDFHMDEF